MNHISIYSTPIINEAKKRGITIKTFLPISNDYIQFIYKGHSELLLQSTTNRTGTVYYSMFKNKALTSEYLRRLDEGYGYRITVVNQVNIFGIKRARAYVICDGEETIQNN